MISYHKLGNNGHVCLDMCVNNCRRKTYKTYQKHDVAKRGKGHERTSELEVPQEFDSKYMDGSVLLVVCFLSFFICCYVLAFCHFTKLYIATCHSTSDTTLPWKWKWWILSLTITFTIETHISLQRNFLYSSLLRRKYLYETIIDQK